MLCHRMPQASLHERTAYKSEGINTTPVANFSTSSLTPLFARQEIFMEQSPDGFLTVGPDMYFPKHEL